MVAIYEAWTAIDVDQAYLSDRFPQFKRRSKLRAYLTNASLRAAFWMRLASSRGIIGLYARGRVLRSFSCDVSQGCAVRGPLWMPHPLGIVLGTGVVLEGPVTLYQHVTLGAGRGGKYPHVSSGATILPSAIVVGGVVIGEHAVVGAGVFCDRDVANGATLRASTR